MKLIEPFTERDIREAILAISSIKSSGPDDTYARALGGIIYQSKMSTGIGGKYASRIREVWEEIWQWLNIYPKHNGQEWLQMLQNIKAPQHMKRIFYTAFTATIYHIWEARNNLIFKEKTLDKRKLTKAVKEDVIQRTLYRAKENTRYYRYIDGLLGVI
ncbi:hypothetical protein Cgig2_004315 [Carnegiea gigantea]|uniref:Uncharacterized protein n=1 Tax=Carnegiea gigantea TaxID=171969 RepID=A0A9Q1JMF9_9CARY|nr:hypothetical protein Cgig2_004315 [Carnegiea gigantea]